MGYEESIWRWPVKDKCNLGAAVVMTYDERRGYVG
jgi:hypothetical protein